MFSFVVKEQRRNLKFCFRLGKTAQKYAKCLKLFMEAGHVPTPGESFALNGWLFTVLEADKKLIHRLRAEQTASTENTGPETS